MNQLTTIWLTALLFAPLAGTASPAPGGIRPGQPWLDTNGELINAHSVGSTLET